MIDSAVSDSAERADELVESCVKSVATAGRSGRRRRVRLVGPLSVLLLLTVVVVGAVFGARSVLRPSSNPFVAWRLAVGLQREELLEICGTPDSKQEALDGAYEQWTYRRGEHSLELLLFQRRLESWRETGPVVRRGGLQTGPCCR